MKFKPTQEQLDTTQLLFIAMIYNEETQKKFEEFETEVLASGTFHYDEEWYTKHWNKRGFNLPEDRILRDRKDSHWIQGLKKVDTEHYEGTDAKRYYQELRKKALAAGYIHGENAGCMADSDVINLQNKLIDVTYDTHKILREDLISMKLRKELLEIILQFFGGLVADRPFEEQARKFNNERLIDPRMIKENYSDSEASFREFVKLKEYYSIKQLLTQWIALRAWEQFKNVEGVLVYTPQHYIIKVRKGSSCEYKGRVTTNEYVMVDGNDMLIESKQFEPLERILFKQFLNN